MEDLPEIVSKLRGHHDRFSSLEKTDGYAHDVAEAIEYWCSLAERAIANDERVNFPKRVEGETLWLQKLDQARLSKRPVQDEEYRQIFQRAERLLELLRAVASPMNGYLGVLRIIRENFGFLETEYGFRVVDEQPTGVTFNSDSTYVRLEHAGTSSLSFSFGRTRDQHSFWIEDLLYLHSDELYRSIPDHIALKTEDEVAEWFRFIAGIVRKYGGNLLRGDEDAFALLAAAQKKRDEEYCREMDRLHGSSRSGE